MLFKDLDKAFTTVGENTKIVLIRDGYFSVEKFKNDELEAFKRLSKIVWPNAKDIQVFFATKRSNHECLLSQQGNKLSLMGHFGAFITPSTFLFSPKTG
jgi:hypothetical protein